MRDVASDRFNKATNITFFKIISSESDMREITP